MSESSDLRWIALSVTSALFGVLVYLRAGSLRESERPLLAGPALARAFLGALAMGAAVFLARSGSARHFLPLLFATLLPIAVPRGLDGRAFPSGEWREVRKWSALDVELPLTPSLSFSRTLLVSLLVAAVEIYWLGSLLPKADCAAFLLPFVTLTFGSGRAVGARARAKRLRKLLVSIGETPQILVRMNGETVIFGEELRVAWTPRDAISGLERIEVALGFEATASGWRPKDRLFFHAAEGTHAAAKLRLRLGPTKGQGDHDRRTFVREFPRNDSDAALVALFREASSELLERRHDQAEKPATTQAERRVPPVSRIDLAA